MNSMTNIYILRLIQNNFYIGKSNNPLKRIEQHMTGKGSVWTKKYPPVSIEKIIPNVSVFDEDKFVKMYMAEHGIDKVRGGAYVRSYLDASEKAYILREIRKSIDVCVNCGCRDHFSSSCPKRKTSGCLRCGRPNHESLTCNAVYDVNGYEIEEKLS
jgi:hypothetical protein